MLLLDTNVLSAIVQPEPPAGVAGLRQTHAGERLVTAAICEAEMLAGIAPMPAGRRRRELEKEAHWLFNVAMARDVLPFDRAAAAEYAVIFAQCRGAGTPVQAPDMMIAAIARAHGATVVTRNVADFAPCGVAILNPWDLQRG